MKKTCVNLLLVLVLLSGLVFDVVAQGDEFVNYKRAFATRTTLKQSIAQLKSRDGERFHDVERANSLVFAKITQAVRPLSDETRAALSLTKSIYGMENLLDVSRNEVEVAYGDATLWMAVLRIKKPMMLRETQPDRGVYLMLRPIGRRGDTPIFVIEFYCTIENVGLQRVLQDAVECATKLNDFTESEDIIEEIGRHWSHTGDWNEEKHTVALSYIRGLACWDMGDHERAEKYLEAAERYINSRPDDVLSSAMTVGLETMGRTARK
ncbi:MAG: hypothetical protein M5R41_16015 [Bacteroidia bacterium]|nr:hypothetical protein [Bacteroidia bacterium]